MPDGTTIAPTAGVGILDRLPPHILAGFTAEQRAAIGTAASEPPAVSPPVNIRLTIPFMTGGLYMTILAGRERRSPRRRSTERRVNPLRTMGNFLFVVFAAIGFYAVAAGAILFYSSVLEF